jgi:8-oxo-dGTP pyrophosphatase MutT (NUDIX family)
MAKAKAKAKAKKAGKAPAKRPAARRAATQRPRHRQYGVIPVRLSRDGRLQILLLTSRGTGRWVVPKGWPMRKRTPAGTAEREAYEEAGVKGWLWSRKPIGSYSYTKADEAALGKILVKLFVLAVEEQMPDWPECNERRTRWFPVHRAAALVQERDLSRLLRAIPGVVSLRSEQPTRKKSKRSAQKKK